MIVFIKGDDSSGKMKTENQPMKMWNWDAGLGLEWDLAPWRADEAMPVQQQVRSLGVKGLKVRLEEALNSFSFRAGRIRPGNWEESYFPINQVRSAMAGGELQRTVGPEGQVQTKNSESEAELKHYKACRECMCQALCKV